MSHCLMGLSPRMATAWAMDVILFFMAMPAELRYFRKLISRRDHSLQLFLRIECMPGHIGLKQFKIDADRRSVGTGTRQSEDNARAIIKKNTQSMVAAETAVHIENTVESFPLAIDSSISLGWAF